MVLADYMSLCLFRANTSPATNSRDQDLHVLKVSLLEPHYITKRFKLTRAPPLPSPLDRKTFQSSRSSRKEGRMSLSRLPKIEVCVVLNAVSCFQHQHYVYEGVCLSSHELWPSFCPEHSIQFCQHLPTAPQFCHTDAEFTQALYIYLYPPSPDIRSPLAIRCV